MAKPSFEEISGRLSEVNEDAVIFDGYEQALVGICYRYGRPAVAAYDHGLCIKILMERDGMDRESAEEFFDFNTLGCWAGEHTPVFVELFTENSSEKPPEQSVLPSV